MWKPSDLRRGRETRGLEHPVERDPNAPIIKLRGLEKSYKSGFGRTYVLRRINVDIKQGEFVTIMNRLNREYIGFVFQSYHLIDSMTVYENLDVPLSYRNIKRSQRKSMVADTLDRFNIVGKKDLYPSQLSGGQQQLVGVARSVIGNPKVLLADEPTGNLHRAQGVEIMELFKRLNQEEGTTIIQVTHSESNAAYGDRVINLVDGWVVEKDPYSGDAAPPDDSEAGA